MKILMIYPRFPETFWSFRHAIKFIRKEATSPPLGLLTVAAMLPPEWPKRLVDANVTNLTDEDLAWADYVFISGMAVQKKAARKIIDRCKQTGVKIIGGGPLFTVEPEEFEDVDHLVLNEAELTLPPFLADLKQGCAKRVYASPAFANIHEAPIPLWDLAEMDKYAVMEVQYSRGCPFRCDFCDVTVLFGHRPRIKTPEQVIAELDDLYYKRGWRKSITFVDDNLIGNKKHLKSELLPALIEWQKDKAGVSFATQATINMVDDNELMRMMVAAGFRTVFIGIETPDEDGLIVSNKKQNLKRDLVADVKRIQRAGMQVHAGFIVGFDSDTPSIFQRQIDFIQKSGIATAMVGLLQAPPKTALYERLKLEGRLLDQQSGGDNANGTSNIIHNMDFDTLHQGYRSILQYIYSPKNYYERVKTFLREYQPVKMKSSFDFENVLAFFRSAYRLGIVEESRWQYWKLFFWTLFHRPRSLHSALALSVYGFHFRKICKINGFW